MKRCTCLDEIFVLKLSEQTQGIIKFIDVSSNIAAIDSKLFPVDKAFFSNHFKDTVSILLDEINVDLGHVERFSKYLN